MKKKILQVLIPAVLGVSLLAGCGSSASSSAASAASEAAGAASEAVSASSEAAAAASETEAAASQVEEAVEKAVSEAEEAAASAVSEAAESAASEAAESAVSEAAESAASESAEAGSETEEAVIKIAASPSPHAEILEKAAEILAEQGVTLEITEFEDYVQPNLVVENGDFDANYFQHVPYLDSFNEEQGTHLTVAGKIHYEPFGLYPGSKDSLEDLADGDSVAVPNDTTNEARALLLLQDNGYITLAEGAGLTATVNDITENPHNLEIVELEAAQIPKHTGDIDYLIMNGNYTLEAGYTVQENALVFESVDSEAARTYVNVIAVKEGNETSDAIVKLVDVLQSDEIVSFIQENYGENVIPFVEE